MKTKGGLQVKHEATVTPLERRECLQWAGCPYYIFTPDRAYQECADLIGIVKLDGVILVPKLFIQFATICNSFTFIFTCVRLGASDQPSGPALPCASSKSFLTGSLTENSLEIHYIEVFYRLDGRHPHNIRIMQMKRHVPTLLTPGNVT